MISRPVDKKNPRQFLNGDSALGFSKRGYFVESCAVESFAADSFFKVVSHSPSV